MLWTQARPCPKGSGGRENGVAGAGGSRFGRRGETAGPRRIHGTIAHDLGVAIVTGHYRPGEILPGEVEFSEQLQVSRSAYREAVRILAAKGLVESRP